MLLCIMLYKVVVTYKSVGKTLVCDFQVVPIILLYKVVLRFTSVNEILV